MLKSSIILSARLIELGANVNAADNRGSTPLHVLLACLGKSTLAIELLEEEWDRWPVPFTSPDPKPTRYLIRLLVSNCGNIYAENSKGHSPSSMTRDSDLKADMVFFTRRSLVLVFEAVNIAEDLENSYALKRVAASTDLTRFIGGFL